MSLPFSLPIFLSDACPHLTLSPTLFLVSVSFSHTHTHTHTHSQSLSSSQSLTHFLSHSIPQSLPPPPPPPKPPSPLPLSDVPRSLAYCNHDNCPMSSMGPLNVSGIPRPLHLHYYVHTVRHKPLCTSAFIQLNGPRGLCNIIAAL